MNLIKISCCVFYLKAIHTIKNNVIINTLIKHGGISSVITLLMISVALVLLFLTIYINFTCNLRLHRFDLTDTRVIKRDMLFYLHYTKVQNHAWGRHQVDNM